MLNISICRKCSIVKTRKPTIFDTFFEEVKDPNWRLKYRCKVGDMIGEGDPIPPNCPHKFEHVVAAGMTVNIDKKGGDV